jgi:hypothetical protein
VLILELILNTYISLTTRVLLFFLQYRFKNILFPPKLLNNLSKGDLIDYITNPKERAKAIIQTL